MKNLSSILEKLDGNTKSVVDLSNLDMGPEEIKVIAPRFTNDTLVKTLNLSNNQLRSEGTIILCKALETNKRLRFLDMSGNHIGIEGFEALGNLLEVNKSIVEMKYGINPGSSQNPGLEKESIEKIAAGLQRNNFGRIFSRRLVRNSEDQNGLFFQAIDTFNYEFALTMLGTGKSINPNYKSKTARGTSLSILANAIYRLLAA